MTRARFAALLFYRRLDLSRPADYAALANDLRERQASTVVMYLATSPALFTTVCEQIAAAGMKFDAGKPMAGLMVSDFANALLAVSEVSTFGAKKYAPHSWATVPNARERYSDALYRHLFLAAAGEAQDQESKLLHAAHVAWNALALLELEICGEGRTGR